METCRVLDDLQALFAGAAGHERPARPVQNVTATEDSWHPRRAEVASVIEALEGHIVTLEQEIASYEDERYEDVLIRIEQEKKRIQSEIESLQSAKADLQEKLAAVCLVSGFTSTNA